MGYDTQLEWMRNLQLTLRSSWMDVFFRGWAYVDTLYFCVIATALIWYIWDRRIGARVLYIFLLGTVLNKVLKIAFGHPRPCHIDPLVGILCLKSFGLPSGAAQTAAIFCGVVFIETKRVLYRWYAVIFAFLLCFSRVYLGVHYPTDILGGLISGAFLLLIYKKVFPLFEKRWKAAALLFPFFLLLLSFSLSMRFFWGLFLFSSTLGIALGLLSFDRLRIKDVKNMRVRVWQAFIVVLGLCALFWIELVLPDFYLLGVFIEGYWLTFLGGWIALRLLKR